MDTEGQWFDSIAADQIYVYLQDLAGNPSKAPQTMEVFSEPH